MTTDKLDRPVVGLKAFDFPYVDGKQLVKLAFSRITFKEIDFEIVLRMELSLGAETSNR